VRADSVPLDEAAQAQIAKVCDEPEIYNHVFAVFLRGGRYTEAHARVFTKLIFDGWVDGNRFDWLILHDSEIVGTIGIKSPEGEIGYWQSNKHPGVMTSAAQSLCSLAKSAGFLSLWAYVKKTNAPSIKVLRGAGFELDGILTAKREDAYGFRVSF
jgi:RimJ/RimL family protein N-acetyltransferase